MVKNFYRYLSIITIIITLISIVIIFENEVTNINEEYNFNKVNIQGTYFENKEITNTSEENDSIYKISNHIFYIGNLTSDIPSDTEVVMRVNNLFVNIWVNKKIIYTSDNNLNKKFTSRGVVWNSFISNGISKNDEIIIELKSVYPQNIDLSFNMFLDNIYYGNKSDFILKNIRLGLVKTLITIAVIIFTIICYSKSKKIYIYEITPFIIIGICVFICFLLDFTRRYSILPYYEIYKSSYIAAELIGVSTAIYSFSNYFISKCKKLMILNSCIPLVLLLVNSIIQVVELYSGSNYYNVNFSINIIIALLCIIAYLYEMYIYKNEEIHKIIIPIFLLSIALIINIKSKSLLKYALFIYVLLEFIKVVKIIKRFFEERRIIESLKYKAYVDALTNVYNRAAYSEKVKFINSNLHKNYKFAIIIFDINNLKIVNDQYGHDEGDTIIINNSKYIAKIFGRENVFRIGGDEFVVILEGAYYKKTNELLYKLQSEVYENSKNIVRKGIKNDFAYGVAKYNYKVDMTYEDVFKRADDNMYINKKENKK